MLEKPAHVKKKIWEQHVTWMNVMREGSLNEKVPVYRPTQKQSRNKNEQNITGGDPSATKVEVDG